MRLAAAMALIIIAFLSTGVSSSGNAHAPNNAVHSATY